MKKTKRVGLVFSLTGATSLVELGMLEACLLGIERANCNYGIQVDPIVADIKCDPDVAAKVAHNLLAEDKVDILIGCYTSACRKALIPVLEETESSLIYPTIYEGEEAHPQIFYLGAVPNQQVDPLLSWTFSNLGNQFLLVGSDYFYPRSMHRQVRTTIESAGGRVHNEVYFPLGCEEFSGFIQEIRRLQQRSPSLVVFSTLVGKSIPAFYRQYRAYGMRNPIVSPITSEVEFRSMGVPAATGHYFADGHLEPPDALFHDGFAAEYRRRYGNKPINGMMEAAYDATQLLANCYRDVRGEGARKAITSEELCSILKASSHETPQGRVVIDSQTQHAWLWTRVARVTPEGGIDSIWTSPGPMPPRPYGERTHHGDHAGLRFDASDSNPFADLAGHSQNFLECVRLARIAAGTSCAVLLTGETGTGKELFAKAIHAASTRRKGPFIAINCAAIPRDLIAAELFGYEGGSFTGANREGKKGKFELANSGTLFLDEIGEMPYELQASLLRALEENKIYRIGGNAEISLDLRIIAATNRNLSSEIDLPGGFRADLYYRLNVFQIDLPTLRSRHADIKILATSILNRINRLNGANKVLSSDAMTAIESYSWPGNIRELENAVERAFHVAGDEHRIELLHLPGNIAGFPAGVAGSSSLADSEICELRHSSIRQTVESNDEFASIGVSEKKLIVSAITMSGRNMSRAARMLGISRSTLYRKLKAFSIAVSDDFPFVRAEK